MGDLISGTLFVLLSFVCVIAARILFTLLRPTNDAISDSGSASSLLEKGMQSNGDGSSSPDHKQTITSRSST